MSEAFNWYSEEVDALDCLDALYPIPREESWPRIFLLENDPNDYIQTITPKLTVDTVKRVEVLTSNPHSTNY